MIINDFETKLKYLIKEVCPYTYPEDKLSLVPDFQNPVKIETDNEENEKNFIKAVNNLQNNYDVQGLQYTYENLSDEYSREMFLKVIVYRLFDEVKLRFPLYYSHVWKNYDSYDNLIYSEESINVWKLNLKKHNLSDLGFDIKLFYANTGILINFVIEQYRYKNLVEASNGDYVIDGGACYGDTALYFVSKVKENGKVFSFEFLDENLNVYSKNIDLNPHLKPQIELIERPLGINSFEKLYAFENGPGTCLSRVKDRYYNKELQIISIDDFVEQNNIEKIDFIKLDIEGSELDTLKGAVNTLKKFRPKLAICAYHKNEDLWEIPKFLKETVPEYNLYLDHFTIMVWETVLFAKAE